MIFIAYAAALDAVSAFANPIATQRKDSST